MASIGSRYANSVGISGLGSGGGSGVKVIDVGSGRATSIGASVLSGG